MKKKFIEDISETLDTSIEDPRFYPRLFQALEEKRLQSTEEDPLRALVLDQQEALSRHLELAGVQEACTVRNVAESRQLAQLLIADDGTIDTEQVQRAIELYTEHCYSLGPSRQYDGLRRKQILSVLHELSKRGEAVRVFRTLSKPHGLPHADRIIRETLGLKASEKITDAHVRRAALAAWFCYLRQSVGSCFATAPAIIVHDEQPHQFMADLQMLLGTGQLKRTFAGVEHSVPLSTSWGVGDLRRPLLMSGHEDINPAPLWHSPGIQAALEAIGLVESTSSFDERVQVTKTYVMAALGELGRLHRLFYCTCERVIRQVILHELKLTEEDIKDFESRPQGFVHSGLLMTPTKETNSKGSVTQRCKNFKELFKRAKWAFIAFADNPLLKAWEFTLASFAETKHEFARWNLHASLGLNYDQPGGIGYCIYKEIQQRLDYQNGIVREHQEQYDVIYQTVVLAEQRLKRASSEQEARYLQADYKNRVTELRNAQALRDEAHAKAQALADLYNFLLEQLVEKFQEYFQEVYDADMHDVKGGLYDDSPAGFRLLYKHGRSNTSQWTMIYNPQEFIDSLSSFFIAIENEITTAPELSSIQRECGEIITQLVNHIKTNDFLESAFYRMAQVHQVPFVENPLDNLDKIDKKPWVYTSGGNMKSLVSCYFRRESPPTESSRWVEEITELIAFFVDTMKELPHRNTQAFINDPDRSMLIHSPTHAFLFKPGQVPFREAWQSNEYTYTFIRDQLFLPRQRFVESIKMDKDMVQRLVDLLQDQVPLAYRVYVKQLITQAPTRQRAIDFRRQFVDAIERQKGLQAEGRPVMGADEVDATLYRHLPMFHRNKVAGHLKELLEGLPGFDEQKVDSYVETYEELSPRLGEYAVVTAQELQNIAKSLIMLDLETCSSSIDYQQLLRDRAADIGLAMPRPIFFADSNWVRDHFAFIVSPGTGEWELWRVDPSGQRAYPMSWWKKWLDGSQKHPDWGIYTNPREYRA